MRRKLLLFLFIAFAVGAFARHPAGTVVGRWTGTWATAMQTPVKSFMPYNNRMSNRSVRQMVKVSAGGKVIRLQLSNIFSDKPVVVRSVYVAHALDSFRIEPKSARYLKFSGKDEVTIPAGRSLFSDALVFDLKPMETVAITINYLTAPRTPIVHMGSRTTSYILKGESTPETDFAKAFRYEKWFNIAALEVLGTGIRTFAIIGNSITDGKGSTTDQQNRWPDEMSFYLNGPMREAALASPKNAGYKQWGVLNLGIGNNRVLTTGFGEPAKDRFDRDILQQHGVTDVVIFEAINDLGNSRDGVTTALSVIAQYRLMIQKCRRAHLRVWLATITPMKGAGYYSVNHEVGRRLINQWIRKQRDADGYLDFDLLMRDPTNTLALRPEWRLSDCLHPNAAGYREMGRYAAEYFKSH